MLDSFYTIVNQDNHFVYFDLGYFELDKKLPRRSGMKFKLPEIRKLLTKAKEKAKERTGLPKQKLRIIHVQYKEVK